MTDNFMGLDGFEFVEFTGPDPAALAALFEAMGFTHVATHRSKDVRRYAQGDINFLLNMDTTGSGGGVPQRARPERPTRWRSASPTRARRFADGGRPGGDAGHRPGRPDGAQHPGDRGDRRVEPLPRRRGRRARDLRHRLPPDRRERKDDRSGRPAHARSPDAQRQSRADDSLGRVLRAHLRLPPDPLFRHRGPVDGAVLARR